MATVPDRRYVVVFTFLVVVVFVCLPFDPARMAEASRPLPPKDLRLLPLSNTELDVDIYPPDVTPTDGEVIGEPTRYNISYEFRVWKDNTRIEQISLEQRTGIVITYMKMDIPLHFKSSEPNKAIDYVFSIMSKSNFAHRKSRSPVPLDTCAHGICAVSLTSVKDFKVTNFGSYNLVYHGYSHFTFPRSSMPWEGDQIVENPYEIDWQVRLNAGAGKFSHGVILAVNKQIIKHTLGTLTASIEASFTPDLGWNLLEFYAFEDFRDHPSISLEIRPNSTYNRI